VKETWRSRIEKVKLDVNDAAEQAVKPSSVIRYTDVASVRSNRPQPDSVRLREYQGRSFRALQTTSVTALQDRASESSR
jgi:hypothetical protein